jgi:hypothetical protein
MLARSLLPVRAIKPVKEDPGIVFGVSVGSALEAAMIGYLVSSVFISTLWYPTFWVITAFITALGNVFLRTGAGNEPTAAGMSLSSKPGRLILPIRVIRPRSPG